MSRIRAFFSPTRSQPLGSAEPAPAKRVGTKAGLASRVPVDLVDRYEGPRAGGARLMASGGGGGNEGVGVQPDLLPESAKSKFEGTGAAGKKAFDDAASGAGSSGASPGGSATTGGFGLDLKLGPNFSLKAWKLELSGGKGPASSGISIDDTGIDVGGIKSGLNKGKETIKDSAKAKAEAVTKRAEGAARFERQLYGGKKYEFVNDPLKNGGVGAGNDPFLGGGGGPSGPGGGHPSTGGGGGGGHEVGGSGDGKDGASSTDDGGRQGADGPDGAGAAPPEGDDSPPEPVDDTPPEAPAPGTPDPEDGGDEQGVDGAGKPHANLPLGDPTAGPSGETETFLFGPKTKREGLRYDPGVIDPAAESAGGGAGGKSTGGKSKSGGKGVTPDDDHSPAGQASAAIAGPDLGAVDPAPDTSKKKKTKD